MVEWYWFTQEDLAERKLVVVATRSNTRQGKMGGGIRFVALFVLLNALGENKKKPNASRKSRPVLFSMILPAP